MREHQKRAMTVKSSRIRFLEDWARKLPLQNPEEVKHAVEVFAQARWKVSKRTARKYAREILRLLNITEEKKNQQETKEKKETFEDGSLAEVLKIRNQTLRRLLIMYLQFPECSARKELVEKIQSTFGVSKRAAYDYANVLFILKSGVEGHD